MAWAKAKSMLVVGLCGLIAAVVAVIAARESARLRAENERLRAELAESQKAAAQQPAPTEQPGQELDRAQREAAEVLRLRGEVAALRRDRAEATRLAEENARLRQRLQAAPTETGPNGEVLTEAQQTAKRLGVAKLDFTRQWLAAFETYAAQNQGQMPTDFNQARSLLPQGFDSTIDPNLFEIVYHGSMQQLQDSQTLRPQDIIVVREREPVVGPDGRRSKAYAFADGHSEVRYEPVEGFDAWEKARILTPQ